MGVREKIGVPDPERVPDPGPAPDPAPDPDPEPTIAALTHAAAAALNAADASLAASSEALSALSGAVEALLSYVAEMGTKGQPEEEATTTPVRPPDCDGTHPHAIKVSTMGRSAWLCPDHGEVEEG